MAYAVLRCQKVKSNQVSYVHNHNQRTYENQSADNVDFERTQQNIVVLGSAETHKKLKENLSRLESKKAIRKDANVLLEFVFSASPEFFYNDLDKNQFEKLTMKENKKEIAHIFNNQLNKEKLELFQKSVVEFIQSKPEFRDNVVNLTLHLDEKTPHFHLTLTPILDGRLTAKKFFTPENARTWQDDFHKHCQQNNLVLERGKEFSPAIHQTLAEYRDNGAVELPQPPVDVVPGQVLPNQVADHIGTQIPFTDKVLTTKTELKTTLDDLTKQIQKRENIQRKHYNHYKTFYNENKDELKKVKQIIVENERLKEQNQYLKKENLEMSYKIKKYTDEQLENLRQIPLVDVAQKLGYSLEKQGSYYRIKNDNVNIVINPETNQYADNKSLKKGFGAINFLRDCASYSFQESVEFLGNDYQTVDIARELKNRPESIVILNNAVVKTVQEIPAPVQKNNPNIVSYLTDKREINPDLVNDLLNKNLLFADKLNNCVFTNEQKTFAYVRGTHPEKRFVANKGMMDFFKVSNTDEPKQIFLFESAIDLLSYRTLNPNEQGIFVSIQGSAMSNRLAELDLNQYQKVVCCFDNDDQGKKFDQKVKEIVPTATVQKPVAKDFNDDLIQHNQQKRNELNKPQVKEPQPFELSRTEKVIKKVAFGKNKTLGPKLW